MAIDISIVNWEYSNWEYCLDIYLCFLFGVCVWIVLYYLCTLDDEKVKIKKFKVNHNI